MKNLHVLCLATIMVGGLLVAGCANQSTYVVIAAGSEPDVNTVEAVTGQPVAQDADDRPNIVHEAKYTPANESADAMEASQEEENDLANRHAPLVLIQALIAEVTLDSAVNIGVEFDVQDLTNSEHAVVGPNDTALGPDFDVVLGKDLGGESVSGFNFAVSSEDFNTLLQVLKSNGSAQVLSQPTIRVENDEEANITIGDQVPYMVSSSVSDGGQANTKVLYENVGIALDLTPHISSDGYVNLEVTPEISSLDQSAVTTGEGCAAPAIQRRSTHTVVTAKDGETVIIGGLLRTHESRSEARIPVLGDIPIVGNLFRTQKTSKTRTDLLIVLTVELVQDEPDAYAGSDQKQMRRTDLPSGA